MVRLWEFCMYLFIIIWVNHSTLMLSTYCTQIVDNPTTYGGGNLTRFKNLDLVRNLAITNRCFNTAGELATNKGSIFGFGNNLFFLHFPFRVRIDNRYIRIHAFLNMSFVLQSDNARWGR